MDIPFMLTFVLHSFELLALMVIDLLLSPNYMKHVSEKETEHWRLEEKRMMIQLNH